MTEILPDSKKKTCLFLFMNVNIICTCINNKITEYKCCAVNEKKNGKKIKCRMKYLIFLIYMMYSVTSVRR